MVRASLFNARLAASPRRAHGSPPSAASPHSRRPPRCARSLQRSPQERAPLHCRRHAPVFGTDPPPRPVSPRTRFAPPLRHSATRAFPQPSGRSVLPPALRRGALRRSPASASRQLRVRTTAVASARASGNVLRTSALSSVRGPFHSVAVAAPSRRLLRRPFPFDCTFGLSFLTAWRGLWFSHPTQQAAGVRLALPWRTPSCAPDASERLTLVGPSGHSA